MYDHELTVVIQQERERAVREAMLHHRYGLVALAEQQSLVRRMLGLLHIGRRPRLGDTTPAVDALRPAEPCTGQ